MSRGRGLPAPEIRRLLKTALRTSSSTNTGLFNTANAVLAIHQDRRWSMGILHLKGHARGGTATPPHCGGGIPNRELLPQAIEVQPRACTCIYIFMYMHGHKPTGAGNGHAAPAAACAAREARPSPRAAPEETGPGRQPGFSSGYWFWNWVKQTRSPVGLRITFTCTCTCTCTCVLACCFLAGYVSALFRGDEGTRFSLVETSCEMCLQK